MSTHAADLESQSSLSMTDLSGCDITKPAPIERGLDAQLDAFRREWRAVARYMVTLSKDGDWNDTTTVAEWLPYDEAVRLSDKLNDELLVKQGGVRRWAQASHNIVLHTPAITRSNRATVGDLLLHEQVEPHGDFNLSDTYVFRQFLVPALVTAVGAGGRIVAYRDRAGEHIQTPKRPHVVSSSVIDVEVVLAHIAANEIARGHWAGEFSGTKAIEGILVRHQRIQAPVYPAGDGH